MIKYGNLLELIEELLTYNTLLRGPSSKRRSSLDRVDVHWGDRIYLELELYEGDLFVNVYLDNKEDLLYIDKFKSYETSRAVDFKCIKTGGYTRFKYRIEMTGRWLDFFVRMCG